MNYPLGWIEPAKRTRLQTAEHDSARNLFLPWQLQGRYGDGPERVSLMDLWRSPRVIEALGWEWLGIRQLTGSCVGAGGGNAIFSTQVAEILIGNQPEAIVVPWWGYTYGISRMLMGERSEGDGSLGSLFAKAALEYGHLNNADPELPQPRIDTTEGIVWTERDEYRWSNGAKIDRKWVDLGRKNLIRGVAELRSADATRTAIRNGYGVTFAHTRFCNTQTARIQGRTKPALVGRLDAQGGHQTSLQQQWDHPELGPLFFNLNQWGLKAYRIDPETSLGNGCWMTERELDRAIQEGAEVYAFSQIDGFPGRAAEIDWAKLYQW